MERKRQSQNKADVRDDRGRVKLERRYGEIGISAVAAASQPQGKRNELAPDQGDCRQPKRER
jgi:hypothetical protein